MKSLPLLLLLLFTPFSVTRFAMHRIYANRINSRGMSRVFCDLRSQKTPRGILPVNSNLLFTLLFTHRYPRIHKPNFNCCWQAKINWDCITEKIMNINATDIAGYKLNALFKDFFKFLIEQSISLIISCHNNMRQKSVRQSGLLLRFPYHHSQR